MSLGPLPNIADGEDLGVAATLFQVSPLRDDGGIPVYQPSRESKRDCTCATAPAVLLLADTHGP
jgi:hypothetical protein